MKFWSGIGSYETVRVLDDDDSVEVEDEDSSSFFNVLQFFRVCYDLICF